MTATVRYLPNRSPTGPMMSWIEPWLTRIGGDHDRGLAHGGAEIGRDLRQQRIGHPHHGLARKAGDREQDDRAGRDFCFAGEGITRA